MACKIQSFLSYTEIKTKITSVFSFLLALVFLFAKGISISPLRSAVFFCGMLLFDLTATAINNYADTKKNNQALPFARSKALALTIFLLALSADFGLWLFFLSDIVVLLAGGLCFFFGIIYSFGPVPLSHTPLGEVFSGFFYGVLIPFIFIQINAPGCLFSYGLSALKISLEINLYESAGFALLTVMPFCLTANIMLANNICDLEADIKVGRFTLAFYLRERALSLFCFLYYLAFGSVVAMVFMGYLPALSLLVLLTLFPVQKNIALFLKRQSKEETFGLSIKNFLIMLPVHIFLVFLGAFFS